MVEGVPIGDKGNISPSKSAPQGDVSSQDNPDQSFKDLVKQTRTEGASKPSPMDAAGNGRGVDASKATPESLVANMRLVLGQMKNLGAALQTPGLKLNARTKRLLDAKLKRSKDHIQFVSSKVNVGDEREQGQKGTPQKEDDQVEAISGKKGNPTIEKFLGYITDGQSQLESAMHNVSHMKANEKNPGMMMKHIFGMQVKLYRAQVEIEFSSAVLQKAIDDLKTIMSVQL